METNRSNKNEKSDDVQPILSNGIILDPKSAANLQVDTIKGYLKLSKEERNYEKTAYLRHLLTNKINVPSNQMLSKAGQFYNYRSYGYETIYQQNKISVADAINQFNDNQLEDQSNKQEQDLNGMNLPSDELAHQKQNFKKAHRSYSPDNRKNSDGLFLKNQAHKHLNTTCLQFKKEKQENIDKLNKAKQHPNSQLQSSFIRLDRNRLDILEKKYDNDTRFMNYYPVYNQIYPSPIPHKFLPLPSTQRREDETMQPDCIIRGNVCEYSIRSITQEMKRYSDKILMLLKKLEDIENKSNEQKRDKLNKDETSKLREMMDQIQEKKRLIGEEILETQKLFIKARSEYEEKVKKNIEEQEYDNFNKQPNKYKSTKLDFKFRNITGRKPLFPEQNVKDICERQYNNYDDLQLTNKNNFNLAQTSGRDELFKVKEGPIMYDHYQQYDQANFQKTNFFVNMELESKKANYYTKHDYHQQNPESKRDLQIINWNKIVEGEQKLSTFNRSPKYTNIKSQTTRDKPNSHQLKTIKVNTNFYKTNHPQQQLTEPPFSARSYSPSSRRNQKVNDDLFSQIMPPF